MITKKAFSVSHAGLERLLTGRSRWHFRANPSLRHVSTSSPNTHGSSPSADSWRWGKGQGPTAESFFLVPTLQRENTARTIRVRSGGGGRGQGKGGGGGSGQCDGSGYGAKDGTGTPERPQDGTGYGACFNCCEFTAIKWRLSRSNAPYGN